ncbi:hypothetical protein [Marinococcus luteus]|uniref:hypothetical protein n=1 Tax=Marinococcus luteus TaxID=1122204 RepID=UPI002ACC718F|nr:hypothetical protein [Marinococcus luteus]MDZ5784133.1 hypothetical protein [Marinococcus luteus]
MAELDSEKSGATLAGRKFDEKVTFVKPSNSPASQTQGWLAVFDSEEQLVQLIPLSYSLWFGYDFNKAGVK